MREWLAFNRHCSSSPNSIKIQSRDRHDRVCSPAHDAILVDPFGMPAGTGFSGCQYIRRMDIGTRTSSDSYGVFRLASFVSNLLSAA